MWDQVVEEVIKATVKLFSESAARSVEDRLNPKKRLVRKLVRLVIAMEECQENYEDSEKRDDKFDSYFRREKWLQSLKALILIFDDLYVYLSIDDHGLSGRLGGYVVSEIAAAPAEYFVEHGLGEVAAKYKAKLGEDYSFRNEDFQSALGDLRKFIKENFDSSEIYVAVT